MRVLFAAIPVAGAASLFLLAQPARAADCTGLELQAVEDGVAVSSKCLEGEGASLPWVDAPSGESRPESVATKPSVTGFREQPLEALGAQAVEDLSPAVEAAEPEPQ